MNRLLFISFIILHSCINQSADEKQKQVEEKPFEKEYPYVITLNKENKKEDINLSSFCDSVIYIPLETNSSSLLPSFRGASIVVANNDIFIFTINGIFLFDISGKFIRKIGSQGKGPGEFISLDGGWVDNTNDTIICNDLLGNKIILYSRDGSYLKSIDIKDALTLYGWGNYVLLDHRTLEQPLFSVISFTGESFYKCTEYLYKEIQNRILLLEDQMFCANEDYLLYRPLYCDTIFKFDSNFKKTPAYILDLGRYKYPYLGNQTDLGNLNDYIFCTNFFDLDKTILFWSRHFGDFRLGSYDLDDREVIFAKDGLINDLDYGPNFYPRFMSRDQKYMGSYIDAFELLDIMRTSTDKKDTLLGSIANVIDENSNPIILLAKVRETNQ